MSDCDICGQSQQWHDEHLTKHKFNGGAASLNEKPPKITSESMPPLNPQFDTATRMSTDPVLRMALVNAGVITVEQLDSAQRMFDTLNGVAREQAHFEETHKPR